MLFVGKYAFLDKMMKFIIFILALFTVAAFVFALNRESAVQEGFIRPELWDSAGLTFLLVLMGWMPTPIDASVWPSLWAMERKKQTGYVPSFKEYKIDFHIGYLGSAVLALFFLGLGALIMYGSGEQFSENGVIFSQQLVGLYKKSIGNWTSPIIATIVLLTMFSTAVTVIDGYPRSLSGSMSLIFPSISSKHTVIYYFWIIILSLSAIIIIGFFTKNMRTLLEFATIISFLTAPFFAFINYKVVTSKFVPEKMHPPLWLKILSWSGMIYLSGFSFVYLYIITF
jgi:Mn2+/Fe2+ NRAMP family transporter